MIACYIYIFSWDCNKTQLILLCIVVAESFILPLKVDSHSTGQQNGVFTSSVFVGLSRQPSSGPQANSLSAKSVCQLTLALYRQRATVGAALCNAENAKQAVVSSGIQSNVREIWIPGLCRVYWPLNLALIMLLMWQVTVKLALRAELFSETTFTFRSSSQ